MKAKHLLAALALPAIFSACTQDELVTNVDKEVVGTPIGYDLEFTASLDGPTTRLASGIGWEENDKIGMGWISDDASSFTATANLYSNHPIYYKAAAKVFKSETMIFEGLYIASFPYQLTQKVAPLEFDLTKQESEKSRYVGRWQVSDKFIDLRDKNAGLGSKTELTLAALTNLVQLNIKLADGAKLPPDFKVTGVTLTGGSKLVNKLVLKTASNAEVAKNKPTLAAACWDITAVGNIDVQVGEKNVGVAIDKTKGLNVYVQLGVLAVDDATTLTIHTNYGDANIATGSKSVSYNILGSASADAEDFASAIKELAKGSTKLGQDIQVGVTLNAASIKANSVISNQTDLANYVSALETLGQLDQPAAITFTKSDLKAEDGVVAENGDVVISDISVLNKIKGAITFEKNASASLAPANVYIAGDLALATDPTVTSVDFTILKDQTLTVSKAANLGSNNVIVNAGATLINKAAITADSVTTTAGSVAVGDVPAVPAGLYISEAGANASGITAFTNDGAVEWRGGALPTTMTKVLYANVKTANDMVNAAAAFALVTGDATKEIIIENNLTVATQLSKTTLAGIKKMTIKGDVTFSLGLTDSFDFSDLTDIDVQSGSFNLTGGNTGTGESDFYAFKTASAGCAVNLASGTELNVAAGTKLDLATAAGSVTYTSASITNNGFIDGNSASGTGTWSGNAIGVNPKKAK